MDSTFRGDFRGERWGVGAGAKAAEHPRAWVVRLARGRGVEVPEERLRWFSIHLTQFLALCRKLGREASAIPEAAAKVFLDGMEVKSRAGQFRKTQAELALDLFLKEVEHWGWGPDGFGGEGPRFRLRASGSKGGKEGGRWTEWVRAEGEESGRGGEAGRDGGGLRARAKSLGSRGGSPSRQTISAPFPHDQCPRKRTLGAATGDDATPGRGRGKADAGVGLGNEAVAEGRAAGSAGRGEVLDGMRRALRVRHYAIRTESVYLHWAGRFLSSLPDGDAGEATGADARAFLEGLALERAVAASTPNQAFSALLFLFRHALGHPMGEVDAVRARRPDRLPGVLSRAEVGRLLGELEGTFGLIGKLLSGTGMRLLEAVRLRVKDVDFDRWQIVVRDRKGAKDRVVMLPESLEDPLREHLVRVRSLYDRDREAGVAGVWLPGAFAVKDPGPPLEWGWQWVFPSKSLSEDPRDGERERHHVHETGVGKALSVAAGRAGLVKRVTAHALRHSCGTAFAGGRDGYPDGAGAAGVRAFGDDDDLHARHGEEGRCGPKKPAGCGVA